jgi:hypothetical protein
MREKGWGNYEISLSFLAFGGGRHYNTTTEEKRSKNRWKRLEKYWQRA